MLPDKNIYMTFIHEQSETKIYIGEIILERIKEVGNWKMIFQVDEKYQPNIKKQATGSDSIATCSVHYFSLNEDDDSILNLCKLKINDFIERTEYIEMKLKSTS